MEKNWTQEERGHVLIWTLDRPRKRNALSEAARGELEEMIARVQKEDAVRAVILTGAGDKAFSAGADLDERARMSEQEVLSWLDDFGRTLSSIEASPKVFIAALNGAALGGGLELALACDLRVASRNAVLGLPEVRLAILPGGGGTQRLPRLIGPGRASDLILTGRLVSAEEAHSIGLVERLAPLDTDHSVALQLALTIANSLDKCGPLALKEAKRAMRLGRDASLTEGLAVERQCYEELMGSRDRLEGIESFARKRPPVYQGK